MRMAPITCCSVVATMILGFAYMKNTTAAEYYLRFGPGDAALDLSRQDNARALQPLLHLLEDFHEASGLRLTLVGADPDGCRERADCVAIQLLKSRVDAVVSAIQHQGLARLTTDLHWNIAPGHSLDADSLRLELDVDGDVTMSPACPYIVEIRDARLPPASDGREWINAGGLSELRITPAGEVRIRDAASPTEWVPIYKVIAGRPGQPVTADIRTGMAVNTLLASDGTADVQVGNERVAAASDRRDVGAETDDWPRQSQVKHTAHACVLRVSLAM
jgi:hypothetical protein